MRKILVTLSDGSQLEATFPDEMTNEEVQSDLLEQLPEGAEIASAKEVADAVPVSSSSRANADISAGMPTKGAQKLSLDDVRKELEKTNMTPYKRELAAQYMPSTSRYMAQNPYQGGSPLEYVSTSIGAIPSTVSDLATLFPRFAVSNDEIEPGMSEEEVADKGYGLRAMAFDPTMYIPMSAPERVSGSVGKAMLDFGKQGLKQGAAIATAQAASGDADKAIISIATSPLLAPIQGLISQGLKNKAFNMIQKAYGLNDEQTGYVLSKIPAVGSTKASLSKDANRVIAEADPIVVARQNMVGTGAAPARGPVVEAGPDIVNRIAASAKRAIQARRGQAGQLGYEHLTPEDVTKQLKDVASLANDLNLLYASRKGEPLSAKQVLAVADRYKDTPILRDAVLNEMVSEGSLYSGAQSYIKAPKAPAAVSDIVGRVGQVAKYATSPENLARESELIRKSVPGTRLLSKMYPLGEEEPNR